MLKNNIKPKTYKIFYSDVAEECEVHENLVEEFIRFFYSEIRKHLEELDNTRILLPNLGTFIIRKNRIERSIKRHKDMLGNLEKRTFKGYNEHLPIKEKLQLMEKAAERINKEVETKKTWKNEHK